MRRLAVAASVVALVVTALLLAPSSNSAAPFCSKSAFYGLRPADFFIGTATADSVLAGVGEVEISRGGGHYGPAGDAPIHGQVIDVDRYATRSSLDASRPTRVVVVPWDYNAACGPVPWGRGSLFVSPGTTGLFFPQLRPEELWVGGLPTYDSHVPQYEAFPNDLMAGYRRGAPDDAPVMTAEALFDVYEMLPTREELEERGWRAAEAFFAWVDEDRSRLSRYPAESLARSLAWGANDAWARMLPVSVRGTYQVDVELPSGARTTFFLRTAGQAVRAWRVRDVLFAPNGRGAAGYELEFWRAPSLAALPMELTEEGKSSWTLSVAADSFAIEGGWMWPGSMEFGEVTPLFPDRGDEMDRLASAYSDEFGRRFNSPRYRADPLRFERFSSGETTFSVTFDTGTEGLVVLNGRWISADVVPGRSY